jgi:hypothetical protein
MLGYYIMDNAPNNNTTLRAISQWLLTTYSVIWDVNKHRLRCFRHVVSLIANAFTTNKPLKAARTVKAPNTLKTLKANKPAWKRLIDVILKLYKIIFFVMRTPARAKEWKDCTIQASDDFLHPIKDNNTR